MTRSAQVAALVVILLAQAGCHPPPPRPAPSIALPPPVVQIVAGRGKDPCPMALIGGGPFLRGSPPGVGEQDERPQRQLELDTYRIDRFAVTVAQYRRCVEARSCTAPDEEKLCNWGEASRKRDDHPVNCVSWEQATAYCAWAGKRLPTEAEWEKAARGTDGRLFPWGDTMPSCSLANYALGEERYCVGQTAPVGAYPASQSPFGVVQLAGNVFSWVADWHDKEYYALSPARNPTGPLVGKHRVVRGGSWFSPAVDLRVAIRNLIPSGVRLNYVGFRCVSSGAR
jgi:formylglycine-generating enzyme required for sulfatase activity